MNMCNQAESEEEYNRYEPLMDRGWAEMHRRGMDGSDLPMAQTAGELLADDYQELVGGDG